MATIRSLKEVRKQYKEKAIETAQVPTGPQPSPPVSECDFYSTATDVMDDAARMKMSKDEDESKVVESENEGREVHSGYGSQSTLGATAKEKESSNNEQLVDDPGTGALPEPSAPPMTPRPLDFLLRAQADSASKSEGVPIIKPVVKGEKPDGFDDFFDSPGLNNKDARTADGREPDREAPAWWTSLLDTVSHVQQQVVQLHNQQVDIKDAAKQAAERAAEIASSQLWDTAQQAAEKAAEAAAKRTAEMFVAQQ